MYVCMYVYYMYTYLRISDRRGRRDVELGMYVCMHACMHVCMHVCMYVCVCMYVYMYTCMYACIYVNILHVDIFENF